VHKYLGNKRAIAVFTLPALILFTVVVFYPIVQVFYRSFFDWDGLGQATFVGFGNYEKMFFKDRVFRTALFNGFIFALMLVCIQIPLGTLLAFSLTDLAMRGKRFLRISYFVPMVLSVTVVCQLWLSIYNAEYGLLNKLFEALGIPYRQDWLTNPKTAIYAVAFVNAWHYMGYHFALVLAAVKSVPEQFFEAAKIDGAGRWRTHFRITVPLLAETYKFCLVLAITGGLNAFAQMFIMTGGGPGTATYTLTYLMYRSAFRLNEFGYGCAAAALLVLECLIVTILINRFVARERIVY